MRNVGKPIKYLAVPPIEVIERVKQKVNEEAETKNILLEELKESNVLEELNLLHKHGVDIIEPSDLVGYFKGRKLIYNQMESMMKNAKKSIILMTDAKGITRKKESFLNIISKAKDRKISVKIAAPITPENFEDAKELGKFADIKHTKNQSRFCIVDSTKIVFMLLDSEGINPNYDCGIWAKTKPFLSSLNTLFETSWESMTPLSKVKF